MTEIPEGGLCLSAFVIFTEVGHPTKVLMGHINPDAPWEHLGALDRSRIYVHSLGWMLPSSHLLFQESPMEAARRIALEQLGLPRVWFPEPRVVSEVYTPRRFPDAPRHWDIEFIFRREFIAEHVRPNGAWKDLEFVDLRRTSKAELSRSHEDIIEYAGLQFGGI